jgi:hypothetical protein
VGILRLLQSFGLWNQVFHDYVGIRKALKAVSQVADGLVGDHRRSSLLYSYRDHRRSSLLYSYNAGSAGLVNGTGCPTRSLLVVIFGGEAPDNFARDVLMPVGALSHSKVY